MKRKKKERERDYSGEEGGELESEASGRTSESDRCSFALGSPLGWAGHLIRMPTGRLSVEVF